jgi:hypothetical protein
VRVGACRVGVVFVVVGVSDLVWFGGVWGVVLRRNTGSGEGCGVTVVL